MGWTDCCFPFKIQIQPGEAGNLYQEGNRPELVFAHSYATTSGISLCARSFATLNDVGIEAGNSRRFGGIHYAPSIAVGHELGKKVGEEVGAISFKK